ARDAFVEPRDGARDGLGGAPAHGGRGRCRRRDRGAARRTPRGRRRRADVARAGAPERGGGLGARDGGARRRGEGPVARRLRQRARILLLALARGAARLLPRLRRGLRGGPPDSVIT